MHLYARTCVSSDPTDPNSYDSTFTINGHGEKTDVTITFSASLGIGFLSKQHLPQVIITKSNGEIVYHQSAQGTRDDQHDDVAESWR